MRHHNDGVGSQGPPNIEIELGQFWGVLRRQWWILLGCTALVTAGALIAFPRPTPVYTASAVLRVEEAAGPLASLTGAGRNRLPTEMEVLRSRTVAGSVVDSLRLQVRVRAPDVTSWDQVFSAMMVPEDVAGGTFRLQLSPEGGYSVVDVASAVQVGAFGPGEPIELNGAVFTLNDGTRPPELEVVVRSRERAIDRVLGSLSIVQPSRQADIVRVDFSDERPEAARDIANAVVSRFLSVRNDAQKSEVRSTIEFLRGQLDAISSELAMADGRLRAFREQNQVIDPGVEGSTQVRRLAELQAERSALQAERMALTTLVNEIEAETATAQTEFDSAARYRRLAAFPALMRSATFSDILRTLSSLENERNALATRRRPEDPEVQVLTARINELEQQLRTFVVTYVSGLSSQIASIDETLSGFEQQLSRLPGNELEFARLSREPQVLSEMYALLQTRLKEAEVAQAVEDSRVRVVDQAVLPTASISARRWQLKLMAISLLGLLLGFGVGFAREYTDHAVYSRSDVETASGLPILGLIPKMERRSKKARNLPASGAGTRGAIPAKAGGTAVVAGGRHQLRPLFSELNGDGPTPASDAYDRLHTNIIFALSDQEPRTLLLTSALPGDGKTTTAVNLALALVRRGLRTLLIDADLRRGTVSTVFNVDRKPGLTELLAGITPLSSAIRELQVTPESALYYIPTGELPQHPVAILESPAMAALLERVQPHFDRIIIDSPPVNIVVDPTILAGYADGAIMVARAGTTPREALSLAAEQFEQSNIPLVGVVLNDVDFERHGSYDPAYKSYRYGKKYYSAGVSA